MSELYKKKILYHY